MLHLPFQPAILNAIILQEEDALLTNMKLPFNFGVFYDWVAKKGTTAGKEAVISMQKTSQGSVEPEKEHC